MRTLTTRPHRIATSLCGPCRVLLRGAAQDEYLGPAPEGDEMRLPPEPRAPGTDSRSSEASAGEQVERKGESPRQAEYRRWWQPVLDMRFDDPDQEPPKLFYPNNVRVALPWPGLTVTAYGMKDRCGVFLSGRDEALNEVWEKVTPHLDEIVAALPENTKVSE